MSKSKGMSDDSTNKTEAVAKSLNDDGLAVISLLIPFISFFLVLEGIVLSEKWTQKMSLYDYRAFYEIYGVLFLRGFLLIGVLGFALSVFSAIRSCYRQRTFALVLSLFGCGLNGIWVFVMIVLTGLSTMHLQC